MSGDLEFARWVLGLIRDVAREIAGPEVAHPVSRVYPGELALRTLGSARLAEKMRERHGQDVQLVVSQQILAGDLLVAVANGRWRSQIAVSPDALAMANFPVLAIAASVRAVDEALSACEGAS